MLSELSEIWLIIIKLISKMSLGTGALKVGQEPERLRHSKEVSQQPHEWEPPLHAAANWHHHTEGNSLENTHLTPYQLTYKPKKGRERLGARIRKDSP